MYLCPSASSRDHRTLSQVSQEGVHVNDSSERFKFSEMLCMVLKQKTSENLLELVIREAGQNGKDRQKECKGYPKWKQVIVNSTFESGQQRCFQTSGKERHHQFALDA